MIYDYRCVVYLADGKHISQVEICESASEAMTRAEAWRSVGHIAKAEVFVFHVATCEFQSCPLS